MDTIRLIANTVVLGMWFLIYLPWIIAGIALEILEYHGPEPVQRLIARRKARKPKP